jgi:aspartyl aminopeptidase
MHGVVFREDGSKVEFVIGEEEGDPVFCISDLLPHLAAEQMGKKMSEAITGEGLNIIVGSEPVKDEKVKEKIKLNILKILNERYGMKEKDFLTAEIEFVPAIRAKEIGLDRSLIGGYGQDDRVCSYSAFKAMLDVQVPKRTAMCILADKEEIGSIGNTGMQSKIFEDFFGELLEAKEQYRGLTLRRALLNTKMLSADVNGAVDPTYESVSEKKNASFLGKGINVTKYTGSKGKSGANDAHAEFLSEIRQLFDREKVIWQIGELGKVDEGGGGTIAGYLANLGMDVLDCGTPILSMHSPYEISSKVDVYMTYKAYSVFLK